MANVVGERYQITIDRTVRKALGIEPGDRAVEWVENGLMVVSFMPKQHSRSLLGVFRRPDLPPIEDWDAVRERAWRARTAEIVDALTPPSERPPALRDT
jgi:bifunctional DNA-binding transcriptional regulator/antitoxin component of YhaV-PrlF toxin-antitoxin module